MPELEAALPKYRQIANHFRDQILRGDLRPGDELPSERVLAVQFSVARPTATKALELLRAEGMVESQVGSGTYVSGQRVNLRAAERYRRSRDNGRIYPPDQYAVIVAAELVKPAPEHVAEALRISAEEGAIRRHRITNNADGPLETSTSWFPGELADRAEKLLITERIFEGTLAYVEGLLGRQGRYAVDRVTGRFATDEEAKELNLSQGVGTAVLAVQHVVLDEKDRPIEFAEATYPPGRWAYEQRYDL